MNTPRSLFITAVVLAALLVAVCPGRAEAGSFSFHVNTGNVGLSVGSGGWTVYGGSWYDPGWATSYDVALNGYGEWVFVAGLGRVWRPWVTVDWAPFVHGRWVSTSLGWTWVSYEPWGYFPHHYGDWAMTAHGWVWRPGYVYSPANVVWLSSGLHIGWYARGPAGWRHHNRAYDHGFWDGYRQGGQDARYATFVSWRHFGAENLSRHRVASRSVVQRSGARSFTSLASGPSRAHIRRQGGSVAESSTLERRTISVGGRQVTAMRPKVAGRSVERHAGDTVKRALAPRATRQVSDRSAVKAPAGRTADHGERRPSSSVEKSRDPERFSVSRVRPGVEGRKSSEAQTRSVSRTVERSERAASSARSASRSGTAAESRSSTRTENATKRSPKASSRSGPSEGATGASAKARKDRGAARSGQDSGRRRQQTNSSASSSRSRRR